MKYFIQTFGCQMNKSDSERIAFVLEQIGGQKAQDAEQADLVVINVCSVRQSAVHRVYSLIKKLKEQKKKIVLTGCLLPSDRKKLQDKVNLIFNIKEIFQLPKKLKKIGIAIGQSKISVSSLRKNYLEIKPLYSSFFSAYVPIMTGCNNFCAYCVVPYVRGREVSRSPLLVLKETKKLLAKGCKRIILLGQNVNSYQGEIGEKTIDFSQLLKMIVSLPGKFWLSFITSHPKDLSDKLIKTVFSSDKICKYFHLPIQSGSDRILKKMNRGYKVEQYKKIIEKIKKEASKKKIDVAISTDIIVGFPSETNSDFEKSASLMEKIKFDMAYIAQYSSRPLTFASSFKDNVDSSKKEKRQEKLFKILFKTALNNNKKYLNKEARVLITGFDKKGFIHGETSLFKNVRILNNDNLTRVGEFVKVKIVKATPWGLTGRILYFSET
ncbi:tRNA (N6-isopentenyl adenosine(37)-C2)-methylthiotransferase MiaB [bacterium (Candidatus Moisslbacteria) CG02_land_8_20_14_3_00_36_53]|nr:MAG: tRNA (N6-isopentenyl adenosine(37)-C2)-methylthiotransferase MiaB [Parcubacteria group bacterium CG2_30_36_38]PIV45961.1 MAG: tRNA (N6-isopentenyl adenosine(37)-C2)-methylthiotransferase MiaB [bacterium (Candidatus Moisslbacteria) CG02_land_8_20_14_3_00_36_53]PJC00565.1 MAG: tRNA (N6-isopentenyl adenosine(37)-C2)-methylthiotransferase MiaB [bacterium (Candidatus Moisslbacteria) CG_4_9_14_0_8_um_filter_36_20]